MGKKKDKKNKFSKYYLGGKKNKKDKKLKKNLILSSASKKTLKKAEKAVENIKISEQLEKARRNHNFRDKKGNLIAITAAEFRAEYGDKLYLVAEFEELCKLYGEDMIIINDQVFEPMITDVSKLDPEITANVITSMKLFTNAVISVCKDEKQVEALRKACDSFTFCGRQILKAFKKNVLENDKINAALATYADGDYEEL